MNQQIRDAWLARLRENPPRELHALRVNDAFCVAGHLLDVIDPTTWVKKYGDWAWIDPNDPTPDKPSLWIYYPPYYIGDVVGLTAEQIGFVVGIGSNEDADLNELADAIEADTIRELYDRLSDNRG